MRPLSHKNLKMYLEVYGFSLEKLPYVFPIVENQLHVKITYEAFQDTKAPPFPFPRVKNSSIPSLWLQGQEYYAKTLERPYTGDSNLIASQLPH